MFTNMETGSKIDEFCGSQFWDEYVTVNTSRPDLTPCFEATVLVWVPCGFLWVFAIPHLLMLMSIQRPALKPSWHSTTKTVLAGLLFLLTLSEFAYSLYQWLHDDIFVANVYFVAPCLLAATMFFVAILVQLERERGIHSTGLLLTFWLLAVICGATTLQTQIRAAVEKGQIEDMVRFVLLCVYCALTFVQLLLACGSDPASSYEILDEGDNPCPEPRSSFLSQITFWWFTPVAVLGYKQPLEREHLWDLNPEDTCRSIAPVFERYWNKEVLKVKRSKAVNRALKESGLPSDPVYDPSMMWPLTMTFGKTVFVSAFFKLINDVLTFVSPVVLKWLIAFVEDPAQPVWYGYFYTLIMFLAAILRTFVMQQYFHRCFLVGMRLRTSVIAVVYKKALIISNAARRTSTVGEIVNLMSTDAQRLEEVMTYFNMIWSAPFQIAVSLWLLWLELGPSILAGLGVMVLLMPINMIILSKFETLQINQMKAKDSRIKLMNEILNGIKVLKLYGWEPPFQRKVTDVREGELKLLRNTNYLNAFLDFMWFCAPVLVCLITFLVFVLSDDQNILTASKAFVSISLFNILRFPLVALPWVMSSTVQAKVSINRLKSYLINDDLNPDDVQHADDAVAPIVIDNATFTWSHSVSPTLSNINLTVRTHSLVAIVGTVGSGKSSLVSALLGEMEKVYGDINMKGAVAYVPQQAWIQNVTLKDNIVFEKALHTRRYKELIEACALGPDLEILPAGDQTEIGEKGINLSGGQKQRVSLARAVYSDADIFLLDDPLSAVDAHVGKHIFEQVIGPDGLLAKKTRVLVTHGVSFLPKMDNIVVMKDGRVSEVGTYKELLQNNGAFAEFLRCYLTNPENEDHISDSEDPDLVEEILAKVAPGFERQSSKSSDGELRLQRLKSILSVENPPEVVRKSEDDKLIQVEGLETGKVAWSVYISYMRAMTLTIVGVMFGCYGLTYAAQVGASIWLSAWSTDSLLPDGSQDIPLRNLRLGVYAALGGIQGIFVLGASLTRAAGILLASRSLHRNMLANVLRSPISFFDTTPLGRIVNRFSQDINSVDNEIPHMFGVLIECTCQVITTLFAISFSTPPFIIVIPFLAVIYLFVQRFYVATSRQLKRLESVSRSPIYTHFTETLQGASTIRAYRVQQRFIGENESRIDKNQVFYFHNVVSNRWLAIRLEFVGACIVAFAALFAVIGRDSIGAGLVGLSVSYALSMTEELNWAVRMSSDLETNIVAVERVKEYSSTKQEAAWASEGHADLTPPPAYWPSEGHIMFSEYSTRYREGLSLVLRKLSFQVDGQEKIGIVGRTGAGKSSITLSLFRIIEPADGAILIDGRNIAQMGLHELRSKLTIIPQDPVLFSGDLRMNLDPFNWYTDDEIWRALEHAHLKTFVASLPDGLAHEVSEGGENLSVGQRQLVCLARALLRKTKVLILDEATAAVDLETDDLIQETIRREFADCTVLTIAHRLNTIMDSSRVIVLDNGAVKEFDSPEMLLRNKSGIFYGMAKDAGLVSGANLKPDASSSSALPQPQV